MSDRDIVRDLAARGPLLSWAHPVSDGRACRECGAVGGDLGRPSDHRPRCVWRRAVEAEEGL